MPTPSRDARLTQILIATQARLLAMGGATVRQEGEGYTADFTDTVAMLEEGLRLLGFPEGAERVVVVDRRLKKL